ncbi:MAG: flagellar filament capping protein FliD [Planctomycetota bacterium]|jgi:flagellar hook-associated protein 2
MSTIRLPGLLTGIDTSKLVAQLMAVERRTLNIYEERQSLWEEKKDALSTMETKLSTLQSTVRALSDADELRAFSTASSDTDILTAEASYNAFEGNHTVVINQLANAERWVHTAGEEYAEDYVGAGTFIYSYNHKETSITTTATTTLEDFVGLINNDANNPGVTASLLYYNNAYHLVLNGNDAGTDFEISVNASSTEVWQADLAFTVNNDNATLNTKITELDQFSGNLTGDEVISINGTDHDGAAITQVDLSVTENTRLEHLIGEINDAFDGIAKATLENGEIILTDNTSGTSSLSISLSYTDTDSSAPLTLPDEVGDWDVTEGGATTADLTGFAEADFTESQSAQDSEIRLDGYPTPQSGIAEEQTLTPTTPASGGTFTLTYDGETTAAISYNATTIAIETALETLSNVNPGDIEMGGTRLNQAGAMTFTFRDTAGDVNMISINSSSLTPSDPSNYVMAEQTKGDNYGWIKRSSNTVDDVIHGVTLHLHDTGTVEVNLTRDIDSVKEKLSSMIDAYNLAVDYIKEKTAYDDVSKTAGVLIGDYIVSTLRQQIRTPLIDQTSGFIVDIDTFLIPAQIGLELDGDGLLSLDTNVFDEAIAEDYMGVLALIGADKTGSSTSNTVEFYGASSSYTTAGEYDVEVQINASQEITSAKIKLSTETSWRDATWSGNIITGDSTFNDNGGPVYPENSLQLSVDLSQGEGTYTATIRVKQGFTGAIEDALDRMLKRTTGSIDIAQEQMDDFKERPDWWLGLHDSRKL